MRDYVYWPNIYKDKETMVKCCVVCQESQTEHPQQPLLAHDLPSTPWTKVASDMFQIKGDNYLLVTDEAMPLSPAIRRSGRMIRKPSRFQE